MLGLLRYNFAELLISVPVTLAALTVHECAHGWVSSKLGDPTPRIQGRMTLNPLAHLDIMGTILMILTGFGWAKPVQVNPMYYKDRKKGMALVALAGPLSNLILAFGAVILQGVIALLAYWLNLAGGVTSFLNYILQFFAIRNLCFAVFNIIPIPPLDGAKVLGMFLPNRAYYTMLQYERYFMIVIMVLSLTGAFSVVIGTGVNFFYGWMAKLVNTVIRILI